MNTIEKALMHALFLHLHHNIDKAIDFEAIEALNNQVSKIFPNALVIGPGDDAAVFNFPDTDDDQQIFEYKGKTIAVIPIRPSEADLGELAKGA